MHWRICDLLLYQPVIAVSDLICVGGLFRNNFFSQNSNIKFHLLFPDVLTQWKRTRLNVDAWLVTRSDSNTFNDLRGKHQVGDGFVGADSVRVEGCFFTCISHQLMHVLGIGILSVRLCVAFMYCVETAKHTIIASSPQDRPKTLVFGEVQITPKFQGYHSQWTH